MIKSILPYIIFFCFFWFLPDLYLLSKNASNYLFKEASVKQLSRVEIKIVKKIPYLPLKYGVLSQGQKGFRVEFIDTTKDFAVSAPVTESGVAIVESMPNSTYRMLVGPEVTKYDTNQIIEIESTGQSVLDENTLIPISIETVTINADAFLAPVIKE
ncbi:MAG: hypothetical protein M3Q44_02555 [bacterium]|nr:hypothetical protein [bacterium]